MRAKTLVVMLEARLMRNTVNEEMRAQMKEQVTWRRHGSKEEVGFIGAPFEGLPQIHVG